MGDLICGDQQVSTQAADIAEVLDGVVVDRGVPPGLAAVSGDAAFRVVLGLPDLFSHDR
ncbi:hypothetical protein [Nonomuraea diastatica]|uniref:hypothetical protein n=1 Tax=Nonomuraea diastatica TaxID=1848329 RepID=UPI00140D0FA6|nr:hypothetical protein [Nonomuraea diastatica]